MQGEAVWLDVNIPGAVRRVPRVVKRSQLGLGIEGSNEVLSV